MKRLFILFFTLVFVLGISILYEILWAPNYFDGDRFIIVRRGENFEQVVEALKQAGVINNRKLFRIAGELLGLAGDVKFGKYHFRSGLSNKEILEDIHVGKSIETISVSIPEGLRASRIAHIFSGRLGVDSIRFMALVEDSDLARRFHISSKSLEGYLMPDTYRLNWQADEEDIITDMIENFKNFFSDSLQKNVKEQGMTIHKILTLASIIELETSIDSERAVIAGVYYNRLRRGMKLQADPTIQYLIDDGPRRLLKKDLQLASSYNTYRHFGLPPGPINNPGKASILAAIFPKDHKYLFFVATGYGGHRFSVTFAQHRRAVRQYRRVRAEKDAMRGKG